MDLAQHILSPKYLDSCWHKARHKSQEGGEAQRERQNSLEASQRRLHSYEPCDRQHGDREAHRGPQDGL